MYAGVAVHPATKASAWGPGFKGCERGRGADDPRTTDEGSRHSLQRPGHHDDPESEQHLWSLAQETVQYPNDVLKHHS